MGAKKQPSYRIIITRKRYKRDGRYIERIGHYDPLTQPATITIDKDRFAYWMSQGAQPTAVVKRIVLGIKGTKKRAPKKAAPEAKPAQAAPADATAEPETPMPEEPTPVEETPQEEPEQATPEAESVPDAPAKATE